MPEFIMEQRGKVYGMEWRDLSDFTQGYIEAMFFTESSDPCASVEQWNSPEFQAQLERGVYGGSFPSECGFSDLAESALNKAIEDCAAFELGMAKNIKAAKELEPQSDEYRYGRDWLDGTRLGQLFWFARNRHGVGFTDDGNAQCLDNLQEAAQRMGEVWPSFGDDGKIYL